MTPTPRVLMVGLDAFDARVARQLVAAGRLPVLAELLRRGTQATTWAPHGVYEGAIWPSMFTATAPTKHGYYCHESFEPTTYRHRATSPTELRGTPFWETLSEAGRRVAVVDMPHTVARPVNGVQITEWGCHDRHLGMHTWPTTLADEVRRDFGPHPIGGLDDGVARNFAPCDVLHQSSGPLRTLAEARALHDDLVTAVDRKTALSLDLFDRDDWDLFVTVFGESHCAGHQFWFLHDASDPSHDPGLLAELGDPVADIYSRLDASLGALLERAGPDTTVFVLLSHGMGQMNSGVFLIDGVLHRLANGSVGAGDAGPGRALTAVWRSLPRRLQRAVAPVLARRIRRRLEQEPELLVLNHELFDRCPGCSAPRMVGADGQPWFVVPNNTVCGGVRLNVVGREGHGVVDPADVDATCRALAADLLEVVKVETGEPLVASVQLLSDCFERSEPDAFPDLLVEWDRRSLTKTVWSPKIGVVHEPYDHTRTGDHLPTGLLVAAGPGIPAATVDDIAVQDLAPTICARLGVPLDGADGRPIPALSSVGDGRLTRA